MTEPRHEPRPASGEEPTEPTPTRIRDKRRIDPETGQVRATGPLINAAPAAGSPAAGSPAAGSPAAGSPAGDADDLARQLAERTADLQRVKAEYDNYRRRVDRDRSAVGLEALASVLLGLLPVLDDIGRARAHGEVEGGFKLVADGLEDTLKKLGLSSFGEVGDRFDPTVHEALLHSYSGEVTEPTCVEILQPGYRLGDRVLRPARVAVAEAAAIDPAVDVSTEQPE